MLGGAGAGATEAGIGLGMVVVASLAPAAFIALVGRYAQMRAAVVLEAG
jgi:hypothetical protein